MRSERLERDLLTSQLTRDGWFDDCGKSSAPHPHPKSMSMKTQPTNRRGLIKYGIAYLLGVPVFVLVIIFVVSRGCA